MPATESAGTNIGGFAKSAGAEFPQPLIEVVGFGPDQITEKRVEKAEDLRELVGKFPVMWINVERQGNQDVVYQVGEIFGLHPLSLEDVVLGQQRPKAEAYADHHFIISRMAHVGDQLKIEQLNMFFTQRFVITFQDCPGDCLEPVRLRLRQASDKSRKSGGDYLAYMILDSVVDAYFPVLEEYGERLETLEDEIVLNPDKETVSRLHSVKRDLLTLRRATWPLRDAVTTLIRDPLGIVTDDTAFYLRDLHDHMIQIIDLEENYRELASDLMDIYLSSISNRMNEIMKILTVIATVFMPLTFIAGIYGMNFNTSRSPWNMPELNWYFGYPLILAVMLVIAVGMLVFFKRRGWY